MIIRICWSNVVVQDGGTFSKRNVMLLSFGSLNSSLSEPQESLTKFYIFQHCICSDELYYSDANRI